MKITDIKMTAIKNADTLKAICSITFDDELVITGVKVIEGKKGLFVSMPQKKNKDNEYTDLCFPITKKLRSAIVEKVLNTYDDL